MKIFAISGLGADERVFQYLKLDHELVPLAWIKPQMKERIDEYAHRFIQAYGLDQEADFGILGVSFGGLMACEMSKLCSPRCTILVSSVENRSELSSFIKVLGKSKVIELIPKQLLSPPKAVAHWMFGTPQKALLNAILEDTDPSFAKWAMRELMNWRNQSRLENLIKIGGTKDKLLPPKGENTILIEEGAHFMIVDKAEEISKIINEQINRMLSKESL